MVTALVGMDNCLGIVGVVNSGPQLWLTAHLINCPHGDNLMESHCMTEAARKGLRHWATEVLHIIAC